MLTDEQLKEIQERAEELQALLADECDTCYCDDDPEPVIDSRDPCNHCKIYELRQKWSALLAHAEEQRAEIERLRAELETWRCYHCGFSTSDVREASAHFGDRDEEEPICRTWERLAAEEKIGEYQSTIRKLESEREENAMLRSRVEGLEYRVEGIQSEIRSFRPFRECYSIQDVFNVYDSMEGRALAAGERAEQLRADARRLDWQPIETAPKDGTRILLVWTRLGWWHEFKPAYNTKKAGFWRVPSLETVPWGSLPTHWRPMPEVSATMRKD